MMGDGTVNVSVRTGAPWWLWLIILALLAAGGFGGWVWYEGWREHEVRPSGPSIVADVGSSTETEEIDNVVVTSAHLRGVQGKATEIVDATQNITVYRETFMSVLNLSRHQTPAFTFKVFVEARRDATVGSDQLTISDDGETVTVNIRNVAVEEHREGVTTYTAQLRKAQAEDSRFATFLRRRAVDAEGISTDGIIFSAAQEAFMFMGEIEHLETLAAADAGCNIIDIIDGLRIERDVEVFLNGQPVPADCDVQPKSTLVELEEDSFEGP